MTTRPGTLGPHAQQFLAAVVDHLGDLPAGDRADLIEQVEQRLHDLDASQERGAIEAHLGTPADLAADLREAAAFPPPPPTSQPRTAGSALHLLGDLADHRRVRPVVDYLRSLRPAWWAVRGHVLVAGVLAAISQGGGYNLHTIGYYKQAFGTDSVHSRTWILIPAAAVIASVTVGLTTARQPRWLRLLVSAVNVLAVFVLFDYPTWWLGPAFAWYTGLAH